NDRSVICKTIYIIANAARGDDPAVVRVGGANAADAETVAPVDIWHGQAGVLDARQERHIGDLIRGLVGLELFQQALVGKDQTIDAHALLVAFGDPPQTGVHPLQRPAKDVLAHDRSLSKAHNHFGQPTAGVRLDAQAVIGDGLHLVGQLVARAVERLAPGAAAQAIGA